MHRRDFLDPRRLLQPLQGLVGAPVPPDEPAPVLLRFGRRAMATDFETIFPFGTPRAQEMADAALDEIDRLESQLTVYREDSEVSRLNARAAAEAVRVESNLYHLMSQARWLWQETGGAFDISVGALIKAWGFFRRQGRVPSAEERAEALQRCGMQHVELGAEHGDVRFLRPGLEINLGSIGKGYALDRVLRLLHRQGYLGNMLLHGGHSSILARGDEPGSQRGWSIGVLHPEQTGRRLGVIHLKNRSLATSAATHQHLEHEGKKLGHLLDPRTGWPAEGMLSATVTAPTATEADALATAFFILGVEGARVYCEKHPEIGAVLLPDPATARPIVLGRAREEWVVSRSQ